MSLLSPPLPAQDRRRCLADALDQLMQTFPKDMEMEKAKLMLTLLLAKKVADHMPSLLQGVFRTTVNFINQNLLTYVRNLFRNVRTSRQLLAVSLSPLGLCPLPTHCL